MKLLDELPAIDQGVFRKMEGFAVLPYIPQASATDISINTKYLLIYELSAVIDVTVMDIYRNA